MHAGPAGHVPTKAVLLIVGSVLCFTLLDTIVKHLAPHYPIPLLVWARLTFQAVAMVIWLGPSMRLNLVRTPRVGLQVGRGVLIVASSFFFMSALKYLPLAEATAISYSSPVLVMMMATLFYPGLVGAVIMTAALPFVEFKTQMPAGDILLVCAAGLLGTLGHLLFILAFQRGPASALVPFTYMQLVWATLIGWFVFHDFP